MVGDGTLAMLVMLATLAMLAMLSPLPLCATVEAAADEGDEHVLPMFRDGVTEWQKMWGIMLTN